MATQPLPQAPMTTTPLPPLLALPLELKLQILSYLPTKGVYNDDVSLIVLRRTHRLFRNIIPRAPYNGAPYKSKFKRAERQHLYLIPPMTYPCYYCRRVLEVSDFGRSDIPQKWYSSNSAPGVVRPLGSTELDDRWCNDCWDRSSDCVKKMWRIL